MLQHHVGHLCAGVTPTCHRRSPVFFLSSGNSVLARLPDCSRFGRPCLPRRAPPPGRPPGTSSTQLAPLAPIWEYLRPTFPGFSTQVGRELRERTTAKRPDSSGRRPSYAMAISLGHKWTRGVCIFPRELQEVDQESVKRPKFVAKKRNIDSWLMQPQPLRDLSMSPKILFQVEDKVDIEGLTNPAMDYHACDVPWALLISMIRAKK